MTRQSIVDAARRRFISQGYVGTTIDQIAADARVTPKTVYAVTGGKRGLLRTVIEPWSAATEVDSSLEQMRSIRAGTDVLVLLAATVRQLADQTRDLIRLIHDAAPRDESAAATLASTNDRIRQNLATVADHLLATGNLKDGVSVGRATDVLQFYFGPEGYLYLVDQLEWLPEHAEQWLVEQASFALLPTADVHALAEC